MEIYASTVESPLVTICIPVYNHEHYVTEAVQSVLSQGVPNIQIILSDDGSQDNSPHILKRFKSEYPEAIDLILHKDNMGISNNIASIQPHIRGKYICWFASDDCFLDKKLIKQIAFMEENDDLIMSYHNTCIMDRLTGKKYLYNDPMIGHYPYSGDIAKKLLIHRCFLSPTSVMVNREKSGNIKHQTQLGHSNDWVYFFELASKGRIGYLDEILSIYYRHQHNTSRQPPNIDDLERSYSYLKDKYAPFYNQTIEYGLAKLYLDYLFKNLFLGYYSETYKILTLLRKKIKKSPFILPYCIKHLFIAFFKRTLLKFKIGTIYR